MEEEPVMPENGDSNENGQEEEEMSMENSEVEQNDDESQPAPTPPLSEEMANNEEIMEISTAEIEPCRLCDDVGEKMFNIFDDNPEGYQLIGLIKENLPIVLYKTDPLSKRVCEKCVLNLQVISGLKKRSRKTQEKYVEKLKNEADTTDRNVLLFLGCTGSKLVDDSAVVDEDEEEEEELKDQGTSTEDLTILCANCKTSILDASTVNGEVELAADLHEIIRESLKKNRVAAGDESEKVLRRRKIQPLYQELEDSSCSSLTELPAAADDTSQYDDCEIPSELDSEESQERPAKRRKLDKSSKEIQDEIDQELAKRSAKSNSNSNEGTDEDEEDNNLEIDSNFSEEDKEKLEAERLAEEARIEQIKLKCEELFKEEPEFTFEPLSLLQIALNFINTQNVPDYNALPYVLKPTKCNCKVCNEEFKNVRLLALHEQTHMDVDFEERIDNPNPWPETHPHAKIRNRWLTCFDENGQEEECVSEASEDVVEDASLLMEDKDKTMDMSKKDEVVLVNMKPMVNGVYLGDYTKEERKAFYQCMRIGGQTKRFCALCRYCFKDNWAIESHYFSFACHYTCRYCGMRFNKQRHRFDEHTKEHVLKKDIMSDKIYTASKVNNTMPKIVQPDKIRKIVPGDPEKPREIRLEDYSSPPVITKGGYDQRGTRYSHLNGERQPTYHQNVQLVKIKEEPKDREASQQSKTQNQAYFCRKCYKVFFKLDEFNAHSTSCDYNSYVPATRANPSPTAAVNKPPVIKVKQELTERKISSEVNLVNGAGRPMRNCTKDIGPYKDEVYIPKQMLNETLPGPPQSFICHICGTPFPTIYSRNSHMRIHKGETPGVNGTPMQQNILKQRLQQQQQQHQNFQMQRAAIQQQKQMQQQKQLMQKQFQQRPPQSNYGNFDEVRIKEEPVSFEPMVEIHEGHETPSPPPQIPSSRTSMPASFGNAISLTPIVKKPALNPNILKLVENNPNISLVTKKPSTQPSRPSSSEITRSNIIKNAGGYQGPYAPTNQQREATSSYITVSPNLMPNDDKSYKCSSCWEAFSNKSHLYFHKKNQCEGSRFPCPFCKKRFGTEAAYSSHIFYSHPE